MFGAFLWITEDNFTKLLRFVEKSLRQRINAKPSQFSASALW